jgi:hypothetical protein
VRLVQRSQPDIQEREPRCCVEVQDEASAAAEKLEQWTRAVLEWYRNSNGNHHVRRQMEPATLCPHLAAGGARGQTLRCLLTRAASFSQTAAVRIGELVVAVGRVVAVVAVCRLRLR